MSNSPFSMDPLNPYQSPATAPQNPDRGNRLTIPAVILVSLSSLNLLVLTASLPGQITNMRAIDLSTPQGQGELVGMIVALCLSFLFTLVILLGSISMLRLNSYGSAMAAAILASIPICSPCFVLGIPFGIWAIWLLRNEDVKRRFK